MKQQEKGPKDYNNPKIGLDGDIYNVDFSFMQNWLQWRTFVNLIPTYIDWMKIRILPNLLREWSDQNIRPSSYQNGIY